MASESNFSVCTDDSSYAGSVDHRKFLETMGTLVKKKRKQHVDAEAVRRIKVFGVFNNFDSESSKEDKQLMMYVTGSIHPGPHHSRSRKHNKKNTRKDTSVEGLELSSQYQFGWSNSSDEKDAKMSL